jgi:hypothetical protein
VRAPVFKTHTVTVAEPERPSRRLHHAPPTLFLHCGDLDMSNHCPGRMTPPGSPPGRHAPLQTPSRSRRPRVQPIAGVSPLAEPHHHGEDPPVSPTSRRHPKWVPPPCLDSPRPAPPPNALLDCQVRPPPPSRHGGNSPVLGVGCQPMEAAGPLGWARPSHQQRQPYEQ